MSTHGGARRGANKAYVVACGQQTRQPIKQKVVPSYMPKRLKALPELQPRYDFWLVQRLERGTRWLGGRFDLDYMGSAEYEFGASHESLDRMRAAGGCLVKLVVMTAEVPGGSVTRGVYFVGPEEGLDDKIAGFRHWLRGGCRSKEMTSFDEIFARNDGYKRYVEWHDRTIAWWSFEDDVMFTLRRDVAEELIYGLQHPAK